MLMVQRDVFYRKDQERHVSLSVSCFFLVSFFKTLYFFLVWFYLLVLS